MLKLHIDLNNGEVVIEGAAGTKVHPIGSPTAFEAISRAWLRSGWDSKYVYTFSWMGRPIIQLPDDLMRVQEVIYQVRPDVILETGVAHGGSLVFYAGLCKTMGRGRVIGVDVEVRPHNRERIEAHELFEFITLVEGDSTSATTVRNVRGRIQPGERVLVLLDSNHAKSHVLAELNAYSDLVAPGSYIVAMDGIMKDLVGAPRSQPNWDVDNPCAAVEEFLAAHPEFECEQPSWPFNESAGLLRNVTYWPGAWLRRKELT